MKNFIVTILMALDEYGLVSRTVNKPRLESYKEAADVLMQDERFMKNLNKTNEKCFEAAHQFEYNSTMETAVLGARNRDGVFKKAMEYTSNDDIAIVHLNYFYDEKDEQHKVVVCYYN